MPLENFVDYFSSQHFCKSSSLHLVNVVSIGLGQILIKLHIPLNLSAVLRHMVDVGQSRFVYLLDMVINEAVVPLTPHFCLLIQANFRESIARPDLASRLLSFN